MQQGVVEGGVGERGNELVTGRYSHSTRNTAVQHASGLRPSPVNRDPNATSPPSNSQTTHSAPKGQRLSLGKTKSLTACPIIKPSSEVIHHLELMLLR